MRAAGIPPQGGGARKHHGLEGPGLDCPRGSSGEGARSPLTDRDWCSSRSAEELPSLQDVGFGEVSLR